MLTQLATVKARLGIAPTDVSKDAELTLFIQATSARFDRECRRTFARAENITQEFGADEMTVIVETYPVESVSKWETRSHEADAWIVHTPYYLKRRNSILVLDEALGSARQIARVTYTGGYVLPGTTPGAGQFALPKDLESAATEQVAAWYQNRDKLGLIRHWPSSGTYLVLSQAPLLISVQAMLRRHERWGI